MCSKTEMETAEALNKFFENVIKSAMFLKYSEYDPSIDRVEYRTIREILRDRIHPSILAIHDRKKAQINFCFKEVSIPEIEKEILNSNKKKTSENSDIPTKIIKENSYLFENVSCSFINDSIKSFTFAFCLKKADVRPIHKKGIKDKKENYRSASILPVLSKILERMMFIEMSASFEDIFNKQQCGFRKGYNTQQFLVKMLEARKGSVDEGRLIFSLEKCGYCQFC